MNESLEANDKQQSNQSNQEKNASQENAVPNERYANVKAKCVDRFEEKSEKIRKKIIISVRFSLLSVIPFDIQMKTN